MYMCVQNVTSILFADAAAERMDPNNFDPTINLRGEPIAHNNLAICSVSAIQTTKIYTCLLSLSQLVTTYALKVSDMS